MTILSSGNVGIGNAAPAYKLDVAGDVNITGNYRVNGVAIGGGSGTVTNVTSANSYLTVATGTTTPALTVNVGTSANTVAAGNDSRITGALQQATAFTGDVSGVYSATSVDKIKGTGVSITALGTGNFLRYNGTNWVNTALSLGDVTTGLGYTPVNKAGDTMSGLLVLSADPAANLGASTKQYVDSSTSTAGANYVRKDGTVPLTADWDLNGATAGGTMKITGLADPIVADGASTKNYVDTKFMTKTLPPVPAVGQNGQSLRWNNTTPGWEYFTAGTGSQWVTAGSDISYTTGNVGIGTTTPAGTLDVQGGTALAGAGAPITLRAQDSIMSGGSAYSGGGVAVTAGNGYSTGVGGGVALNAGRGNFTSGLTGNGASLSLFGSDYYGPGGGVLLSGGSGSNGYGNSGQLTIGSSTGVASGGSISIAGSGSANGGDTTILGGAKSGAGTDGNVLLATTRGNVGIGTTTPGVKLDVYGAIRAQRGSVTVTSPIDTTQTSMGATHGLGIIETYYPGVGRQPISIYSTGMTVGSLALPLSMLDVVGGAAIGSYAGTSAAPVNGLIISGNVGIGNTAPAKLLHVGSASVGTGLAVANFQNVDGTCTITPASSGSGIACSSDERLKENFQDVTGAFALNRILQLQAVTYNFKTSSSDNRRTGYKAQEVQKVAPEFVRQNEDGLLQVYYDAFIPWITEAIKTLYSRITGVENHQAAQDQKLDSQGRQIASKAEKTEVDQLKTDNAAKDKKIKELEQRLEKIEKALNSK